MMVNAGATYRDALNDLADDQSASLDGRRPVGTAAPTNAIARPDLPKDLRSCAHAIVVEADLDRKVWLAKKTAQAWHHRRLSLNSGRALSLEPVNTPGRPADIVTLAPRKMPKRSTAGLRGRIALIHALAHIELSAVDMTWDLIARFHDAAVPRSFFDDWVRVGVEEAKHFELLSRRLSAFGSHYGALPVHDGLWEAAQGCGDDLLARIAIIPLVLEARGLDVGPAMLAKMQEHGDDASARVLDIIYHDEKRHVAFGFKWFRHLCAQAGCEPEPTFHRLVRTHFRGQLRPPFNEAARAQAGLTPGFYKPLAALGH